MEPHARNMLVGGFVLVLVAGLIGFVIWLGKFQLEQQYTFYRLYFTGSVTGLNEGSNVRLQGVPVGTVKTIRIDPQNVQRIEVVVQVAKDTPIRQDAEASLGMQGITGIAYIQIHPGKQESPLLVAQAGQDMAEIPARASRIEQILDSIPAVMARIEKFLSDDNQKAVTETLQNVSKLTGALADHTDDFTRLATDGSKTMKELSDAARSAKGLTEDLRKELAEISPDIRKTAKEIPPTIEEVRAAAAAGKAMATQFNDMIAENRAPLRDFAAVGLYDLTQLAQDMRTLVSTLNRVSERMEANPSRFLFGDPNESGYQAK
ncbi:MAG: MlaD family protein [Alphaproteobacteria bacterium]|nr:MlaD family protein [Alphaproteobacteria bacterium]